MMPKLLLVLMIVFGVVLILGAKASEPFAEIDWSDRNHALLVVVIAAIAIALYQRLGFILTMSLLVFTLAGGRRAQEPRCAPLPTASG